MRVRAGLVGAIGVLCGQAKALFRKAAGKHDGTEYGDAAKGIAE